MKDPVVMTIAEALERRADFDAIVDARSPAEFAEDRLPGALSAPVLDDDEHARVGTIHAASAFDARRLGAAIVSRNIADLLERRFADCDRSWRPLVYCWRGGNRSGALATVMARIGWRTTVLEGGYRAYRRHVIADLESLPTRFRFMVVAGRTGSAKSRLLERLQTCGEQVLDLEALAAHRGSVLGGLPGTAQPSQKHFETQVWSRLERFETDRPVFVESESRKVGQCQVPAMLIAAIRGAQCTRIEADAPLRAAFLLDEYRHFRDDVPKLLGLLDRLTPLHGAERITEWKSLVEADRWPVLVERLLTEHYDPAYDRSMGRNFVGIDRSPSIQLKGVDDRSLDLAAEQLITLSKTPAVDPFKSDQADQPDQIRAGLGCS